MAASELEGQRRQVTVLFADMADYTPTAERLGEEAVFGLMRQVIAAMGEAVRANQGKVQTLTGDGMMALFGAPVAIEDAPLKACRAALDIQSEMRRLEAEIEARHGVRPKFRIGINTGPVVVGRVGGGEADAVTALGDTINLAARLEGEAGPGGIVMSEATHRLVEGYVEATFEGARAIKGKTEPQPVYRLDRLKGSLSRFELSVSRGLTALVGRGAELEALHRCWEESRQGGLRIVNVIGEAGLGKSRLVHDFRARLDAETVYFLQGRCTSSGTTTPFLPFIDVVRAVFRIDPDAGRPAAEQRLRRGLELLAIPVEATMPYLMNLLGHAVGSDVVNALDSEVVGVRTRNALVALLRERRRVSPVVMFIDDLHWMDSASQELLVTISKQDRDLPLLLICAFRPEYAAPWVTLEGALDIRLDRLGRAGTIDILKSRFDVARVPDGLADLVASKAEGNPLFAEEIANYLLEKGVVERSADRLIYHGGAGTDIPVSIENLLMDRVDRLAPEARSVLEAAAVISTEFSVELVRAAAGMATPAAEPLSDLQNQDLIIFEADRGGYRLKHALVREAIYRSLLGPAREALHGRIAEAIEDTDGEAVDALAWHYGQTPNDAKAVHYNALAGERSLIVYSLDEAEAHFRAAIARIEAAPGSVGDVVLVDVLLKLARVLYFSIDFYGIIAMVERYQPVVEGLGDPHRLARFLFETGYAHVFSAQQAIGKPMLERALSIGEQTGDAEIIGYASMGLMWHYQTWEQPSPETRRRVEDLSRTAAAIGIEIHDVWLTSKALLGVAIYFSVLGRPGECRRRAMRLIAHSRTTNDPRPRAMGLWMLAINNAIYFNYEEAIENADEAIAIGLNPVDRTAALGGRGMARTMLGQVEAALRDLGEFHTRCTEGGLLVALTVGEFAYGVARVLSGDMAGGVRWIEEWRAWYAAWGFFNGAAFYDLYLGEIYLQMAIGKDKPPGAVMRRNFWFLLRTLPFAAGKARRHLEAAAGFFGENDMPALEAWSLMDLGRLHAAKKRPADARRCLERARPLAEAGEEPALIDRIDGTLKALPVSP